VSSAQAVRTCLISNIVNDWAKECGLCFIS
jgi:hypothetical protein